MTQMTAVLVVGCTLFAAGGCLEADRARVDGGQADTDGSPADTASPCAADARRCADEATLEVCRDGAWSREPCPADFACLDLDGPACERTTGSQSCRSLLDCTLKCRNVGEDEGDRDRCEVACILDGTAEAQGELADLIGCLDDAACGDDLECIGELCRADLASCFYEGRGALSCAAVLTCRAQCASAACEAACADRGSFAAQADLAVFELCVLSQCGLVVTTPCLTDAVAGPCAPYYEACLDE